MSLLSFSTSSAAQAKVDIDAIKGKVLLNHGEAYAQSKLALTMWSNYLAKKYEDKISTFVSEKDKGIYDGLNKGISLATGDIIAFLHSDDIYANENIIQDVVNVFENNDTFAMDQVLDVYKRLLATDEKARIKALDDILAKQSL